MDREGKDFVFQTAMFVQTHLDELFSLAAPAAAKLTLPEAAKSLQRMIELYDLMSNKLECIQKKMSQ